MPLTQRATFAAIRALGLTVSIRDGEYRVTIGARDALRLIQLERSGHVQKAISRRSVTDKAEAIAYYTNDRQDAVDTARFMAARLPFPIGPRPLSAGVRAIAHDTLCGAPKGV